MGGTAIRKGYTNNQFKIVGEQSVQKYIQFKHYKLYNTFICKYYQSVLPIAQQREVLWQTQKTIRDIPGAWDL
jgi:hypothetical protein